uniref:scarecrow-like protein 15 n=1 Tax=Erigeron canadensis TaxID=72917 RepID=UPI001CB95E9F|nr:scarecrow-like protein 15 [Erigeron canadensis]
MKLPFIPSQENSNIINTTTSTRNYEPKSVLDIRCSPSSSVTADSSTEFNSALLLHHQNTSTTDIINISSYQNGMNNEAEECWDSDSLMKELGLIDHDSSNCDYKSNNNNDDLPDLPPFFYPEFDPNIYQYPPPFDNLLIADDDTINEFDYRDELTRLAECCETQSFQLAHVILARLNQILGSSPNGKPLQRAAFYFKEAFQSLLTDSDSLMTNRRLKSCTSYEVVQVIKAYKMFSSVSPIPLFASFTANQAILDAVDGAMIIHVIDFDIGFGGQWASFLKAVSEKAEARKVGSPAVRITAVVKEEYELESRLIRENLIQFCVDLKLRFEIEFVSIRAFELVSFKAVKFVNGEKTAVVVTPTIFRRIGSGFVNNIRRVSPDVVVYVDGEVNVSGSSFLRQTVCDGLELYATVIESLEAANGNGDWVSSIEMFVLLPKIIAVVEDVAGRNVPAWREVFGRGGMRPVGFSQFADFQAECLLRRVQVRGFHVVKRQAEMVLCWHNTPLVATSAWTC